MRAKINTRSEAGCFICKPNVCRDPIMFVCFVHTRTTQNTMHLLCKQHWCSSEIMSYISIALHTHADTRRHTQTHTHTHTQTHTNTHHKHTHTHTHTHKHTHTHTNKHRHKHRLRFCDVIRCQMVTLEHYTARGSPSTVEGTCTHASATKQEAGKWGAKANLGQSRGLRR